MATPPQASGQAAATRVSAAIDTIYGPASGSQFSGDTVAVINGATCNGAVTTGCSGPFPIAATGASPLLIAGDTRTGTLYVTDFSSASVTVLNASRCNAGFTGGCGNATREQAVGSGPFGLAVNPRISTVYVANRYLPGSMSILATTRH